MPPLHAPVSSQDFPPFVSSMPYTSRSLRVAAEMAFVGSASSVRVPTVASYDAAVAPELGPVGNEYDVPVLALSALGLSVTRDVPRAGEAAGDVLTRAMRLRLAVVEKSGDCRVRAGVPVVDATTSSGEGLGPVRASTSTLDVISLTQDYAIIVYRAVVAQVAAC